MRNRVFKRTVRKKLPTHHPLLALDVENDPKTGKFICAAVNGEIRHQTKNGWSEKHIEKYFDNQQDFLTFLDRLRPKEKKEIPTKIILFNASYDYWFLIGITDDSKLLTSGSNIITGKLTNGITIMDLTNLTRQGSLEDWIGYLKAEMGDLKKESLDNLEKRVKSDAKATWILGNFLENFFTRELGIPMKLTIAACSRYLFSLRFFEDYWLRTEKQFWINDYERKAYRGGRVECFVRGKEDIYGYDVNSMYLSVMRDEKIPDPNNAHYTRNPKSLPEKDLYIADVTVTVPTQYVGCLPFKDGENGKLLFPTGTFRSHLASPELNYAIKECGVKLIKIHSIITYTGKSYFKDFAKLVWKKRKEYKQKENKGMDLLIKYLGNTLYGGFGQKNKDNYIGKLKDYEFKEGSHAVVTKIKGVEYVTQTATEGKDSSHTFPCVPVFIASYARLKLLKALRANQKELIYCDTDSMKLRGKPKGIIIGKELGEWDFEGYEKEVIFYKPKMYGLKCKGIPKRATLIAEGEENKYYTFEKPNKMRESFKRGLTPALWKGVLKAVQKIDDKRDWESEKKSIPPTAPLI